MNFHDDLIYMVIILLTIAAGVSGFMSVYYVVKAKKRGEKK